MRFPVLLSFIIVLSWPLFCQADTADKPPVSLVVEVPAELRMKSATATVSGGKASVSGQISGQQIRFAALPAGTACDVSITQPDGTVLQGVDLGWYDPTPVAKDADPLTPADRQEIQALVEGIKDFHNNKHILTLNGSADRATGLLRLIRDTEFHAGRGQIVWRIETWYFENQAGGWAIVDRQNKIIRRERFKTVDDYKVATMNLRFVPALGGLRTGEQETRISLAKGAVAAAFAAYAEPTQPATQKSK